MSMDLVEQLFKHRWPRLYLDTAELITIGRGHLPKAFIDEFIATIEQHSVVLVISDAHIYDALKPGDQDAPGFLASTLERFWIRGLVDLGPAQIEPWVSGRIDIGVLPWGNVRDVLHAPAAVSSIADHDFVQTVAHAASLMFKVVQQSASPRPKQRLSNNHDAIVVGAANVLAIGLRPDAPAAVDYCAQSISCTLTGAERAALIERVAPAEAFVQTMSPVIEMTSQEERLNIWQIIKAGADVAPGLWLAKKLAGNRHRNIDRAPDRSDTIDLEHCAHIPYVDIVTCDKQAYAAVAPYVHEARGTRTPTIFRNGQLEAVLTHIKTLPTRDQIFEQALQRSTT